MIRDSTEKHFLSATHYSTNAFFRHQLGQRFTRGAARSDHLPDVRSGPGRNP